MMFTLEGGQLQARKHDSGAAVVRAAVGFELGRSQEIFEHNCGINCWLQKSWRLQIQQIAECPAGSAPIGVEETRDSFTPLSQRRQESTAGAGYASLVFG
jgi:hypothetical protein